MAKIVIQPSSLRPSTGPIVPGTKRGTFVFTSGQTSVDKEGNIVGEGDIRAQTRQVLANVKAVLEEGGAELADVMKVTVFLTKIGDIGGMNEVFAEFFGQNKPARSTVEAPLANPKYLVEIEAIAMIGD